MKLSKYILEIVVFVCGAVVMVFELVGSRVFGPYFGTSIFIWTSLIGIILGSLSLGYYFGGKLADKKINLESLSLIIFLAAICIGFSTLIKDFLIVILQLGISDVRLSSVLAAIILFFPASFLLGMVSPYAVKLKIESLSTTGSTVGNLYAISTAGSIIGTFLAGFYLIPQFGTNKLLVILSVTLIITSLLISTPKIIKFKLVVASFIILIGLVFSGLNFAVADDGLLDIDTTYNRIWIYDRLNSAGEPVKIMGINNENHSAMFLNSDELVNEYTKYYHLASHFNPDFKKTLMIGGAGYSYPKSFLVTYPEATIDVVEIDPQVTELAKKYFRLPDNSRLTIYHEDGRVFLNKTTDKYDVIFGDAFSSHYSIPYQLTTQEAVQRKFDILNNNGVVILNTISSVDGDKGRFLRAEYLTYKSIFPQVFLFPVREPNNPNTVQNIILVALKSEVKPYLSSPDFKLNEYLQHLWTTEIKLDTPILRDDFAPVDYYINN